MITDLNNTLKQMLMKNAALDPSVVDIVFDAPTREWSASVSKPTVNFYLYDMRENHPLRNMDWVIEKGKDGMATRRKSPNRVDLSYIVTVWSNNIEDQHNLLWRILTVLFQNPVIPQAFLQGQLKEQQCVIPTATAQPDGLFSNPADFWAALDNDIKPSINYVVTLPLDLSIEFVSPLVKTTSFGLKSPDTEAEHFVMIRGLVHVAGRPSKPLTGVTVVAKEVGMTAVTDENGEYIFGNISQGKHTFQVFSNGKKQKEVKITIPDAKYDIEV